MIQIIIVVTVSITMEKKRKTTSFVMSMKRGFHLRDIVGDIHLENQ